MHVCFFHQSFRVQLVCELNKQGTVAAAVSRRRWCLRFPGKCRCAGLGWIPHSFRWPCTCSLSATGAVPREPGTQRDSSPPSLSTHDPSLHPEAHEWQKCSGLLLWPHTHTQRRGRAGACSTAPAPSLMGTRRARRRTTGWSASASA
jgi:hypothetical protein